MLLKNAIQNLAEINGCTIGTDGFNLLLLKNNNDRKPNVMLCGNVVCNITAEEYKQWVLKWKKISWHFNLPLIFIFRQKQNAIAKMCANRIESDEYPIDIISKLCHVSIVYELLSVCHNKVVNTECNRSNKDS